MNSSDIVEAPSSVMMMEDIGEMDAMTAIDFLIEENKKLWKEKAVYENVSPQNNSLILDRSTLQPSMYH